MFDGVYAFKEPVVIEKVANNGVELDVDGRSYHSNLASVTMKNGMLVLNSANRIFMK